MIERFYKFLYANEKVIFFLVVFAFSMSFFSHRYFVTEDGPAHLYNANLLTQFFDGTESPVSDYFEPNPFPVPNWTGHIILAFLNLFLTTEMVEKVFLFFYFFAFLYSFKYLVQSFSKKLVLPVLLITPFALSLFVYTGFYNFCIAFIFLFIIMGFFVRHCDAINLKRGVIMSTLLLLAYFSHITIAVFAVFFLFLYLLWNLFSESRATNKKILFTLVKKSLILLAICFPVILMVFLYALQHTDPAKLSFLKTEVLMEMIWHISPLVGHGSGEHICTQIYFAVISVLFVFSLIKRLKKTDSFQLKKEDIFLLLVLILAPLYFILPDGDGKGGYISVRTLYIIFLLIFLRVIVTEFPKWLQNLSIITVLITLFFQIGIRQVGQKAMSKWATMVSNAGEIIEPNSVVLPVHCSSHWQAVHLSNYLGAKKPLVLLDNYEANHIYFPLRWKKDLPILSTSSSHPDVICKKYFLQFDSVEIIPDYLFFYGYFEIPLSCENDTASLFTDYYNKISGDDFYAVYKKR